MEGLTHVYYGYGKGKTTAAVGLALRAAGSGKKVVIVQFLKNMKSSEVSVLENTDNITLYRGQASNRFTLNMSEEELKETARIHNENLYRAIEASRRGECDMLVLDEALDAYRLELLDKAAFEDFVKNKPKALELVITGHESVDEISGCADYITEMVKIKHPYDKGISARDGIEF